MENVENKKSNNFTIQLLDGYEIMKLGEYEKKLHHEQDLTPAEMIDYRSLIERVSLIGNFYDVLYSGGEQTWEQIDKEHKLEDNIEAIAKKMAQIFSDQDLLSSIESMSNSERVIDNVTRKVYLAECEKRGISPTIK